MCTFKSYQKKNNFVNYKTCVKWLDIIDNLFVEQTRNLLDLDLDL